VTTSVKLPENSLYTSSIQKIVERPFDILYHSFQLLAHLRARQPPHIDFFDIAGLDLAAKLYQPLPSDTKITMQNLVTKHAAASKRCFFFFCKGAWSKCSQIGISTPIERIDWYYHIFGLPVLGKYHRGANATPARSD
jgi:hypothetical protein